VAGGKWKGEEERVGSQREFKAGSLVPVKSKQERFYHVQGRKKMHGSIVPNGMTVHERGEPRAEFALAKQ